MAIVDEQHALGMVLVVTPDQRDALIYACDETVEFALDLDEPVWSAIRLMPVVEKLADDLILANANGDYEIRSPTRDELISFLEHRVVLSLDSGMEQWYLRVWHTCVTLLAALGHEPEGSVYEKIVCGCPQCQQWARLNARLQDCDSDEERVALYERYVAEEVAEHVAILEGRLREVGEEY